MDAWKRWRIVLFACILLLWGCSGGEEREQKPLAIRAVSVEKTGEMEVTYAVSGNPYRLRAKPYRELDAAALRMVPIEGAQKERVVISALDPDTGTYYLALETADGDLRRAARKLPDELVERAVAAALPTGGDLSRPQAEIDDIYRPYEFYPIVFDPVKPTCLRTTCEGGAVVQDMRIDAGAYAIVFRLEALDVPFSANEDGWGMRRTVECNLRQMGVYFRLQGEDYSGGKWVELFGPEDGPAFAAHFGFRYRPRVELYAEPVEILSMGSIHADRYRRYMRTPDGAWKDADEAIYNGTAKAQRYLLEYSVPGDIPLGEWARFPLRGAPRDRGNAPTDALPSAILRFRGVEIDFGWPCEKSAP